MKDFFHFKCLLSAENSNQMLCALVKNRMKFQLRHVLLEYAHGGAAHLCCCFVYTERLCCKSDRRQVFHQIKHATGLLQRIARMRLSRTRKWTGINKQKTKKNTPKKTTQPNKHICIEFSSCRNAIMLIHSQQDECLSVTKAPGFQYSFLVLKSCRKICYHA